MGSKARNSLQLGNSSARKRLQPTEEIAALSQPGDLMWGGLVGQAQLRVLVVDDDADAAEGLSTMVKAWGHQVLVARDGAAAVEMAPAYQADVVLLDIVMPKLDGCQTARRLRRQARFEDTLLIGLMGKADREHRPRAEKAGFDLCLVKPVEPSTLEVLLFLEQDRLAQPPAPRPATPPKNTARNSATTRIDHRFPAADEESGCLSYVAYITAPPTNRRQD